MRWSPVKTEELQWQTDIDPVEVAWAMAHASEQSESFRESLHGQNQILQKSEFKDLLGGRQA